VKPDKRGDEFPNGKDISMQLDLLTTSWQRALGAMFHRKLGERVLVFVYPHEAPRLFHTFFCPPLRIVAVDGQGDTIHDQTVPPGKFVTIPSSRIVLEADPGQALPSNTALLDFVRARARPIQAALDENVPLDRLLFATLAHAVGDLRRVIMAHQFHENVCLDVLREKFDLWERGQIASSAGFILEFNDMYAIPVEALRLSRVILRTEAPYLDELYAAAVAGIPWKGDFPGECLRCGKRGSWRQALDTPLEIPPEAAWRYQRPENAVPLCHKCVGLMNWHNREALRREVAWGLWGARFEALWRWQAAALAHQLPEGWDRQTHPLWPELFGGATWETGSGALEHTSPRPPEGLARTPRQSVVLARSLFRQSCRRSAMLNNQAESQPANANRFQHQPSQVARAIISD
jgi:uncharacterized membrane protein (UPF0127 family)